MAEEAAYLRGKNYEQHSAAIRCKICKNPNVFRWVKVTYREIAFRRSGAEYVAEKAVVTNPEGANQFKPEVVCHDVPNLRTRRQAGWQGVWGGIRRVLVGSGGR
jgi:hypothetical protein